MKKRRHVQIFQLYEVRTNVTSSKVELTSTHGVELMQVPPYLFLNSSCYLAGMSPSPIGGSKLGDFLKNLKAFAITWYTETNQRNLLLFIGSVVLIEILYPAILESVTTAPQPIL